MNRFNAFGKDGLLKRIICSSWFLAFVPAVIIMIFVRPYSTPYQLDVTQSRNLPYQTMYADLDSDSVSERLVSHKYLTSFYISAQNSDNRFIDQWNLYDSISKGFSDYFTGNYDRDKQSEIYIFTCMEDSLFLNLWEMTDPDGARQEHVFISTIGKMGTHVSSGVFPAGFYDTDKDGFDELYFVITSSFRSGPRRIYYYNIEKKQLSEGPYTTNIPLNPRMSDADNDGIPEIFGTMGAPGNYLDNDPYSDSSSWFMVFTDSLRFKFPPVRFHGFANNLDTKTFNNGFVLLHWAGGADTSVLSSRLMLRGADGRLLREKELSELPLTGQPELFVFNNAESDRIILASDVLVRLNSLLEPVKMVKVPFKRTQGRYRFDIDNDGEDEILIYSVDEGKLALFSQDLVMLCETDLRTPDVRWNLSHYFMPDKNHQLFIEAADREYYVSLVPNKFYYLSFLTYPGIYISFFIFILLIRKVNTFRIVQKEELRQKLLMLQLRGIKTQLDPHFTFNAMDSVASLIRHKDRHNAYDYMNRFTQLMRVMLNDADRVYRYLAEELEFVITYFELQKLRFEDKFDYKIECGEGVTQQEKVPKLVLHTFAENAIRHGIMPKQDGGKIVIRVNRVNDYLRIEVEDDGVGREAAGRIVQAGKGLLITDELYSVINQLNSHPVSYKIFDLFKDSGEPAGTKVVIMVPVDLDMMCVV